MKCFLRALILGLACLASVSLTACGSGGDQFANRLTFGTGLGGNGFDLVGENTTFTATPNIYFKLESAEDIGVRKIILYFNDGVYATKEFQPTQDYGHYFLSSFTITDPGSYVVRADLHEKTGPDTGYTTFIATSSLTLK